MRVGFCLLVLLLSGCSASQLYNAGQENRRAACRKLPPQQAQECLKQHETSYEEYLRQRQEVID